VETLSAADLAIRLKQNPLLKPADLRPSRVDMTIECLLNPGVFRFRSKMWLLLRVAERPNQKKGRVVFPLYNSAGELEVIDLDKSDPDLDAKDARVVRYKGQDYLTTLSHLRLVCSEDGIKFYEPEGYQPIVGHGSLETFGIEDCRVTELDGVFNLTYTMVSPSGVGVGLMQTTDWKTIERKGMIFPPHNKDCCIFSEKINEKYYALHRPSSPQLGGNFIWLAESPDLLHWGNHRCLVLTREGMWDSARVGAGAAPIKTDAGWLEIYHGATSENRYCLGALLLDLHDPSRVIARSEQPILEPLADYEQTGFFGNVVFTNGHIVEGDTLHVYYGASDEVICGATFSIKQILNRLLNK
jgi:beta-1,2-mannobiose phosphorylase / 1,2-beta-oligomannan phosphorylase